MPLTRRIPLSFWLTEWNIFKQKNVNGTEKLWWDLTLAERIVIPSLFLLLQLWGIIAAPLLLLDTLLTILILSARSERLAAFTGAVIGAGAGELFRLSGAVPTLEPVLTFGIGFLCGYLSGPLLYRAMKILGRPNETTVVTAY